MSKRWSGQSGSFRSAAGEETGATADWLLQREFSLFLARADGSPERRQVAGLLVQARGFVLTPAYTAVAAELAHRKPGQLEARLGHLGWPERPLWLEYEAGARFAAAGALRPSASTRLPQKLGALIAPFPRSPGFWLMISAWGFGPGQVNHALGLVRWRRSAFEALSKTATEGGRPADRDASLERLMTLAELFVPDAFDEEIRLLGAADLPAYPAARAEAERQACIEHPFVLAALALMPPGLRSERTPPDGPSVLDLPGGLPGRGAAWHARIRSFLTEN